MSSIPPEVAAAVIDAEMMVLGGLSQALLASTGVLLLVTLAAVCWLTLADTAPLQKRQREMRWLSR